MMASFELAWRRVFLFDPSSAEQGWCSSSLWLRNPGFGHVPSAWRRWHSVPIATLERGRSIEFPSEGNVSGYVCNHSSLRMGTRHCVSWSCFGHSCRSPLKKKRMMCSTGALLCSQTLISLRHRHPPANVRCIGCCNHASGNRSHRRRSHSDPRKRTQCLVPILRELWLHT